MLQYRTPHEEIMERLDRIISLLEEINGWRKK